ncbi:MAG: ABC transporter permease [Oscillospiraceae bacterium]|jgi:oligopeptide transport system permease protein|nr:ABC transporter permease [Oscillospiraceae bacterium]
MNNNESFYPHIPASEFAFVGDENRLHDKELETKPVSYFRDVLYRFSRNKSSVVAACIILFLALYAFLVPIFGETTYSRSLTDTTYLFYSKLPPKSDAFAWLGADGTTNVTINNANYLSYRAIGQETGMDPVVQVYREDYNDPTASQKTTFYDIEVDEYYKMGMMYLTLTTAEYQSLQAWQNETGIQVIYPAITDAKQSDANIWYKASKKGIPELDKDGNFESLYRTTTKEDTSYNSLRVAGDTDPENPYAYARVTGTSESRSYVTRIHKYTYFQYRYGFEPSFIFGTNGRGQDIFTRLAAGARFSFVLAIVVSAINLFIGAIYGAIEGYYGGAVDMVLERISDVLAGVPFIVVTTLFQLHLAQKVGAVPALLFAFVMTGWIGMASRVRMQFYRFKGQEYILAARTLGARDMRLMFKHIFPNSLGTIITGSVLSIPGVIFSETSLSYLGIVNLESSTMTSVGTMLSNGNAYLATNPYIMFFPALFISLLMISFNLFGNGLRDAFNPSLRGAE